MGSAAPCNWTMPACAASGAENKVLLVAAESLKDAGHALRVTLPPVATGRKRRDLPAFQWINTVLGNLKTCLGGSYHAFAFAKHASRYLAAFAYRLNRRLDLETLTARLLVAVVQPARHPTGP